jgi:hypothetical protein
MDLDNLIATSISYVYCICYYKYNTTWQKLESNDVQSGAILNCYYLLLIIISVLLY